MNLFGVMSISASALQAERVRAEVVAANMANAETTRTTDGSGPYRRQHVIFSAAEGGLSAGASGLSSSAFGSSTSGDARFHLLNSSGAAQGGGVEVSGVVEDQSAPLKRFEPGHPDADADGYVSYPDINPLSEMVDLMGATRAYGMNASALQAEKNMVSTTLDILK